MRNTRQRWYIVARAIDPGRIAFWRHVYGSSYLPVVNDARYVAFLPGLGGRLAYALDVAALQECAFARMAWHLSDWFAVPIEQIFDDIMDSGAPVLAAGVVIDVMPLGIPAPIVIERVI